MKWYPDKPVPPWRMVYLTGKIIHLIAVTSWWAWWRFKWSASRLFAEPFVRVQIKENVNALRHWPLWGESTGDRWIPLIKASITENVSFWWRHHVSCKSILKIHICGKCHSLIPLVRINLQGWETTIAIIKTAGINSCITRFNSLDIFIRAHTSHAKYPEFIRVIDKDEGKINFEIVNNSIVIFMWCFL